MPGKPLPRGAARRMVRTMEKRSPIELLRQSGPAWLRFKRLMALMGGLTLLVITVTLTLFYREFGMVSIHFYIATALGVGFAMMLMAVLMGLVFLSNSAGHDAAAGEDRSDGGASR
jgi:hypothetical protein